jgi:hypothetical protein
MAGAQREAADNAGEFDDDAAVVASGERPAEEAGGPGVPRPKGKEPNRRAAAGDGGMGDDDGMGDEDKADDGNEGGEGGGGGGESGGTAAPAAAADNDDAATQAEDEARLEAEFAAWQSKVRVGVRDAGCVAKQRGTVRQGSSPRGNRSFGQSKVKGHCRC